MPKPEQTPPNPSPRAAKTVLDGKKKELTPEEKRAQIAAAEAEDEATRSPRPPKPAPAAQPADAEQVKDGWLSGGLTFFD